VHLHDAPPLDDTIGEIVFEWWSSDHSPQDNTASNDAHHPREGGWAQIAALAVAVRQRVVTEL
jgi:hypothetical protein